MDNHWKENDRPGLVRAMQLLSNPDLPLASRVLDLVLHGGFLTPMGRVQVDTNKCLLLIYLCPVDLRLWNTSYQPTTFCTYRDRLCPQRSRFPGLRLSLVQTVTGEHTEDQ